MGTGEPFFDRIMKKTKHDGFEPDEEKEDCERGARGAVPARFPDNGGEKGHGGKG